MTMSSIAQRRGRTLLPSSGRQDVRRRRQSKRRPYKEQSRQHPAPAPPPGRSTARNPSVDRMQSAVRLRIRAVDILGHPRPHRNGCRQHHRRCGGAGQGHLLLPRLPPRRKPPPRWSHQPCRNAGPAQRRSGLNQSSRSSKRGAASPAAGTLPQVLRDKTITTAD